MGSGMHIVKEKCIPPQNKGVPYHVLGFSTIIRHIAHVTLTSGMVIFGKVACEKWLKQMEIDEQSKAFVYQTTGKRLHSHHMLSHNLILCYVTEDDVLKICNFAENCSKTHICLVAMGT